MTKTLLKFFSASVHVTITNNKINDIYSSDHFPRVPLEKNCWNLLYITEAQKAIYTKAICDYCAQNEDELSFNYGDVIWVISLDINKFFPRLFKNWTVFGRFQFRSHVNEQLNLGKNLLHTLFIKSFEWIWLKTFKCQLKNSVAEFDWLLCFTILVKLRSNVIFIHYGASLWSIHVCKA